MCYIERPMPTDASTERPDPSRSSRLVLTVVILVVTLVLDLWSKDWAWENLRRQRPMVVIDPLLEFSFSFNLGAAFGFLNDASWARLFFITVTLLALAYMTWLAFTLPTRQRYSFVAVGLISAGAAGNLHDRLMRANDGGFYGVVDFIKINYPWGGSWPTFNVADVLLLVGVMMLFVFLRREGVEEDEDAAKTSAQSDEDGSDAADEPAGTEADEADEADEAEPAAVRAD